MRVILILTISLCFLSVFFLGMPSANNGNWFEFISGFQSQETRTIFSIYRIPEWVAALIAGAMLSSSGLFLQTFLNNPLASSSILGVNAASHLFVALGIMGTSVFAGFLAEIGVVVTATLGAFLFSILLLFISFRLKSSITLLIIGIMLGTFLGALTDLIVSQSDTLSLKQFTSWSFGSLKQLELKQVPLFFSILCLGIFLSILVLKPLNLLLIGEKEAMKNGLNYRKTSMLLLIIIALFSGSVTSFCGPIAFVGLIVPNAIRWLYKSANHFYLFPICAIGGACFLIICAILIRFLEPYISLPLNVLSSLVGAPIVVFFILKKVNNASIN